MKRDLDPEWLRTSMMKWRHAVAMEIPVPDSFNVHFIERRGSLLKGFVKTGSARLIVLLACKAEGHDLVDLKVLKADVTGFKKWADSGLTDLNTIALQESMKDNVQKMLADLYLGDIVRRVLNPKDLGKQKPAQ